MSTARIALPRLCSEILLAGSCMKQSNSLMRRARLQGEDHGELDGMYQYCDHGGSRQRRAGSEVSLMEAK